MDPKDAMGFVCDQEAYARVSVPGDHGSDQRVNFCGKKFPGMGPLGGMTVDAGR